MDSAGDFRSPRTPGSSRPVAIFSAGNFSLADRNAASGLGYIYWISDGDAEARRIYNQVMKREKGSLDQGDESRRVRFHIVAINAIQSNPSAARCSLLNTGQLWTGELADSFLKYCSDGGVSGPSE